MKQGRDQNVDRNPRQVAERYKASASEELSHRVGIAQRLDMARGRIEDGRPLYSRESIPVNLIVESNTGTDQPISYECSQESANKIQNCNKDGQNH